MGKKAVIFDVDGVLLDSLTPHLQICRDKNREYGLGLSIPCSEDFKKMVREGTKISPMNFFFTAIGFPEKYAKLAFEEYKEIFMKKYAPKPFPLVDKMLYKLSSAGLKLGIVTSNVRKNIVLALGLNMKFFEPECVFTKDDIAGTKANALRSAVKRLKTKSHEALYVGDQPSDWEAAKDAKTNFLGVSYGWGISGMEKNFKVVSNVMDISEYILRTNQNK